MSLIQRLIQKWKSGKIKLVNDSDWVTIAQSIDEFSIRIDKLKLEDEGIPAMLFDQRDSSYNAFGYVYLKVLKKDEENARKLLNLTNE